MKKTLYSILALFMVLAALNSCSSEDPNIIPPDHMEESESPTQQLLKQTYSLFGLKKDDCKDFMGFPGIITKDNALALTAIKQANSKLVFAVYDSLKKNVVICDSSYVIPSQIQETYYDENRNYEVCGLKPSILRTKNEFVGVTSVLYKHSGSGVLYRNFVYILNDGKLTCLDSTQIGNMPPSFLNWGEDAIMMLQSYSSERFKNTLLDLDGNIIFSFDENDNYNYYNFIRYSQKDFVQYKFDSDWLSIGRKHIDEQELVAKKWSHCIEYPEGFDSYKLKYTYTQDENILTFHVSGIQKNGETERFEIRVNVESGKYKIITNNN